ncbi:MAG TPA: hypothetical protein VKK06_23825 [Terriglobia bacterium]|nr:hypothetical protein [Terriglobia bacterium]
MLPETAATSAVTDVLELNFNTVRRVNQNLNSVALPCPRLRVSLRQRNIRWSDSDPEHRLTSAVILKSMNSHSEHASIPLVSALQIITTKAHMVERADAYR